MKKKLLISAYSLDIGGIETALVSLINHLCQYEYDITLVLEKKQGLFFNLIDRKVKIIEYKPNYSRIRIVAKLFNMAKRLKFLAIYGNKFDCSIDYATYSLPGSFVARASSKNSLLWVHGDYLLVYENNIENYKDFFYRIRANKFRKIIFVSDSSKKTFLSTMKGNYDNNNLITVNNYINYKKILSKANNSVIDIKKEEIYTFLYVGRLTEEDKKISRIIESADCLKKENFEFRIIIIGDGKDSEYYKEQVELKKLQKNILFLGKKENPYPYFRLSDCLILTSEYEGFPVVYTEAMILSLPIITTDVSDSKKIIQDKYGIVVEKDISSICQAMKQVIKNGFKIKQKFNPQYYNAEIAKKINKIIEGKI